MRSLVEPLFDGPLDIVGDVHGQMDALRQLVQHLGYPTRGEHPQGRRLVFVGDLINRGPDSLSVVQFVQERVAAQQAQCVLGNHELRILFNQRAPRHNWYFGTLLHDRQGNVIPQRMASSVERIQLRSFFLSLPVALERPDLRVVHACWNSTMVDLARAATNTMELYHRSRQRIEHELRQSDSLDELTRTLALQNRNPIAVITSGPWERSQRQGRLDNCGKYQRRVAWWHTYDESTFCVFGHYSHPVNEFIGNKMSHCIDFGAACPRLSSSYGRSAWTEVSRLAALRHPELQLVFDNGQCCDLHDQRNETLSAC